jgi:parallel beta-helix repeat protein
MSRKGITIWLSLMMVMGGIVCVDVIIDITSTVRGNVLYVNTTGTGGAYTSIQDAIDNANDGDIIYVYNGSYYENVEVDKTINLIGESKENTVIDGSGSGDVVNITVNWVNITGFTITNGDYYGIILFSSSNTTITKNIITNNVGGGIYLELSYSNIITNNVVSKNQQGITNINSSNNQIENNTISNRYIGVQFILYSNNNTVKNNTIFNNQHYGIYITYSLNNLITNNNINNSDYGILISGTMSYESSYNIIRENNISNNWHGIYFFHYASRNKIINTTLQNNGWGVYNNYHTNNYIINSTVISQGRNFYFQSPAYLEALNVTFNKTKVDFKDTPSTLTVKWFLHINAIDYLGNPVPNASVKVEDNLNGSYMETFTTDGDGHVRGIPVTEYIHQKGEKTFFTPHRIIAWNDTLVGYVQPIINKSKIITIVLYNATLMDLELGWNLLSLPRIQSDNNLQTVLQSIEGQYDVVQWYNVTDNNDPWKHNHISKSPNLNDLNDINPSMGLWAKVTDPGGSTLIVFGDVLTSTQNITLYPGWNLVGYPSISAQNRTNALNNIDFGNDVNAIWTFNASTQAWEEITEGDNFELGRGYWIHSKVTKTWIVPL